MTDSNRFGRQRLAWAILTGSFFSCILLSVTIPLGIRAILQNSTQSLDISVQANQGTVGIEEQNGQRRAVLVGEPPQTVGAQSSIRTDTTASALLTVRSPEQLEPLTTLQVSGNSIVQFKEATAPRFGLSGRRG